ncbi:hypothetical protein SAMN02910275_00272 [Butyrivibrio sp. INlla18]|uniref:hypothetical protein n=1 Tax=Butyrivibrio sp. INlla18 TaxID=1520806 RepID=UPI0008818B9B|nr:hypothetical protein [Butyrivibrio sp. INlla18]SDA40384.1 hypothetical protein SAMN02910275_00272 [Butyrivibrio sp. INlla18]
MNIQAYFNPDFTFVQKLIFLLMTFAAIGLCVIIIYGISVAIAQRYSEKNRDEYLREDFDVRIHKLFEMIISGTSVMSFSCAYVIINHVYSLVEKGVIGGLTGGEAAFIQAWADGKDFMLLLLICLSCVINSILDALLIPLKLLTGEEKATMRMLGMFYVIILLIFLNAIGDGSQYGPVMMYYFGLMIGRFVYFDASFKDFVANIKRVFLNLPYLLASIVLTAVLGSIGFKLGYFLERNYYIVGIFYTQLFLLVCVALIHYGKAIIDFATRKRT